MSLVKLPLILIKSKGPARTKVPFESLEKSPGTSRFNQRNQTLWDNSSAGDFNAEALDIVQSPFSRKKVAPGPVGREPNRPLGVLAVAGYGCWVGGHLCRGPTISADKPILVFASR
jgi:hypothetical protein